DIHLLGGLCQDDVGGYEHAARPQHARYLAEEGATGREVKHGFDTRDAVKAAGGERQVTGIGPYPAQRVVVQRVELSTEGELTRVDVDAHENHVPKMLIEVLQRRTESTTHVQHALRVVHVSHIDENLVEPLDGALDFP